MKADNTLHTLMNLHTKSPVLLIYQLSVSFLNSTPDEIKVL